MIPALVPAAVVAATLITALAIVLWHALRDTRRHPAEVELPVTSAPSGEWLSDKQPPTGEWFRVLGAEPTREENRIGASYRRRQR